MVRAMQMWQLGYKGPGGPALRDDVRRVRRWLR